MWRRGDLRIRRRFFPGRWGASGRQYAGMQNAVGRGGAVRHGQRQGPKRPQMQGQDGGGQQPEGAVRHGGRYDA